jgi:hypothetical protein
VAKTNRKVKAEQATTRSHRFGAFTRRATVGKAQGLGKFTAKIAKAAKNTAVEFKTGFSEESKS